MTPDEIDDAAQTLREHLWQVVQTDYPAARASNSLEGREFLAIVTKAFAGLVGMLLAPLPLTDELALRLLFEASRDRHYHAALDDIEAEQKAAKAQASKPS